MRHASSVMCRSLLSDQLGGDVRKALRVVKVWTATPVRDLKQWEIGTWTLASLEETHN